MDTSVKVSVLEDEVKILKNEIKNVLREIRTSILSQENPFSSAETAGPVFRALDRPPKPVIEVTSQEFAVPPAPAEVPPGPPPATAILPSLMEEPPMQAAQQPPATEPPAVEPPTIEPPGTPPASIEMPAAQAFTQGHSTPPQASHNPAPAPAAAPPAASQTPLAPITDVLPGPEMRWSLMTIAALASWVEEAHATLGAQRLHIIMDLAEYAGMLPAEVKEALLKLAKLGRAKGADGEGSTFSESLVVLRQLDAILNGENIDEITVRRTSRRYGRIR